ncbi:hypothetical protein Csa_017814 [Cucumis sativus]|nr:hypothetical protein Csa_017814 [Cucumis sativus]
MAAVKALRFADMATVVLTEAQPLEAMAWRFACSCLCYHWPHPCHHISHINPTFSFSFSFFHILLCAKAATAKSPANATAKPLCLADIPTICVTKAQTLEIVARRFAYPRLRHHWRHP